MEMKYSGFWRRFLAYMIDGLIVGIAGWLLGAVLGFATFSMAFSGIGIVIGFLYAPFFDCSTLMGTPGKALMKMVVVTETGERLTFKTSIIRYICKFFSGMILGLGYLIQPFTEKKQSLHDLIARTVVIDREVPDLNYFHVWKDQFKEVVSKL